MIADLAKSQEETDKQMKETDKKISALGSTVGNLIETLVGGSNIVKKFRELNYVITKYSQNIYFGAGEENDGEIDIFLENGDIAILVEVKTTLRTQDIRDHIERLEKYRRYTDNHGGDKRRYIGAVAGANVHEKTVEYALNRGLYVIVQTGDAFKIVQTPEGFAAKEW